jgi:Na+/H+ antiporter NhaD/arsenite permease-like protein
MLIGQVLQLSFSGYMAEAAVPSILGLVLLWFIIARRWQGKWKQPGKTIHVETPPYSIWQTAKGVILLGGLVVGFLVAPWPREMMALGAAGVLLCSRKMRSREMLGLVDWQLLVLFMALFVVNYTIRESGYLMVIVRWLAAHGFNPENPAPLFGLSVLLSNLVSNVPAVMLLLPSATSPLSGAILALSSTLAGNLLVVGSIANIIVIEQAARLNVRITWREHARVGIPVTLTGLAVAAVWFWVRIP